MHTFTWDYNNTPNFTYRVDGATSGTYYETKNKTGTASNNNADAIPFLMADRAVGEPLYGVLQGNICELAIWNRVLTSAEITTLYASGDGLQLDTGLKVWKEKGTA